MLLLCGRNSYSHLDETSNNKNMNGDNIISPFIQSKIDPSIILSYSTYENHAVIITKKGEIFGIGPNNDKQIFKTSLKQKFDKLTKFDIIDNSKRTLYPISAVCCSKFTLFLVSETRTSNKNELILSNKQILTNIGDSNPMSLFGGFKNAASIDTEGSVIIISNYSSYSTDISYVLLRLNGGEKAISVACCDDYIIVAGSNGNTFITNKICGRLNDKNTTFSIVEELKGTKIVEVTGTHNHCFAVSEDGRVFGFGSNKFGELGIGSNKIDDIDKFTEISPLKKFKIKSAYAGFDHSLFMTDNGKILTCGSNWYGQLLGDEPSEECVYLPYETKVVKNSKFCVAGFGSSSIFIGNDPINSPNRRLLSKKVADAMSPQRPKTQQHQQSQLPKLQIQTKQVKIQQQPKPQPSANSETMDRLMKAEDEILHLQRENMRLRNENESLRQKIKILESKKDNDQKPSHSSIELFEQKTIDEIKILKTIGHGNASEVYEVSLEHKLALKVLDTDNSSQDAGKCNSQAKSEALINLQKIHHNFEIMLAHSHNNIIQTFGFCYGDENHHPSILFQYCPHNLSNVVEKMSDKERICAIFETCLGLEALHAAGLIHGDLKPENILIDENGHVRVSDYSLSSILYSNNKQINLEEDSFKFVAPELLNDSKGYDKKVDVYSFGVLAFYILTKGKTPEIDINEIKSGKKISIPDNINKVSKDLISHCVKVSPKERPSFTEIIKFIKGNKFKLINGVEHYFGSLKQFLSV